MIKKIFSSFKNTPKGIALLLVMTVILVVLSTITVATTLLLNNLDQGKSREDSDQALISAQAGIEKVKGYYANDHNFFATCSVNDCIDFTNASSCVACTSNNALFNDGDRRYRVMVTSMNPTDSVGLLATGYQGLYARSVRDAVQILIFICGDPVKGILKDRDGYEYPTVLIDGQCWTAASMRTKSKRDDTCINGGTPPCPDASSADDNMGRSCYDNDENNCAEGTNGALYTWAAIMDGDNDEGAQGLCPDGWHVPSDRDWGTLETFLTTSGTCESDRKDYQCDNAGETLAYPNGSTGFGADLNGSRWHDGHTFQDYKSVGIFWSSTGDKPTIFRQIQKGISTFGRDEQNSRDEPSYSLRCLKD